MADTAPETNETEAAIKDAGADLVDAGTKAADAVDVKAHDLAATARDLAEKAKTRFAQAVDPYGGRERTRPYHNKGQFYFLIVLVYFAYV